MYIKIEISSILLQGSYAASPNKDKIAQHLQFSLYMDEWERSNQCIIFRDEAHIHLSDFVNFHNNCHWCERQENATRETNSMVWILLLHAVWPFFFEDDSGNTIIFYSNQTWNFFKVISWQVSLESQHWSISNHFDASWGCSTHIKEVMEFFNSHSLVSGWYLGKLWLLDPPRVLT